MRPAGKPAIDLCEQAVHLLRRAPASAISLYYLGALPFVLGLLFFWTDMSESSVAHDRAAPESLALAILYIWMATCQALFARQLRARLLVETPSFPRLREWLQAAAAQAAIQPTKFIVLPVALLIALPLAAALAFYHNAAVSDSLSSARRQASLWPKQNWTFLGILAMLAIVVFVNCALTLLALPYLAKMFLGLDTVFTRSPYGFLNTTFLAAALGVSYLILNPFVRAFYVLRCFYGESLHSGQDLRAELKLASATAMLLLIGCAGLRAQVEVPPPQPNGAELERSIERVLRRPEYSWRLPRKPIDDHGEHNWLVRNTIAFLEYADQSLRSFGSWIEKMIDKLAELLGDKTPPPITEYGGPPPARNLRLLLAALLAAAVGIAVFLTWQALAKRRRAEAAVLGPAGPPSVDLHSADLQASDQPLDQWLQLARDCIERGELRLALRALYLAGLSTLAGESLIALHRGKSDRDYAHELKRRARNRPQLVAAFKDVQNIFERGWYGMYEVDARQIEEVRRGLDQLGSTRAL